MGRKPKPTESKRTERKSRDNGKVFKKKPCLFCKDGADWIDYKDVNLLRRYMSDRAKIKARRVSGNCARHQRDLAVAIKNARELSLLPFATRVTSSRGAGRGGRDRGDRAERGPRDDRPARDAGTLLVDGAPVTEDGILVGVGAGDDE